MKIARWVGWGVAALLAASQASAFDDAKAASVIGFARTQLANTAGMMPATQSPKSSRPDGTWTTVANTDLYAWTQGFFPGSEWLLYQAGAEPLWRGRADDRTRPIAVQAATTGSHDHGFKFFTSFGEAYRLTDDPYYRDVLLTAAAAMATRYKPVSGIVECCDWNPDWRQPAAVDTMVELELLLWGAQNGGPSSWRDMAVSHSLKTIADMIRPDGSTYHIVDYEPASGAVRWRGTWQGYSDETTWSRGQAWAIYGFTMVYRYTNDARMLQAAQRTADWYLAHLPADQVPNWDFEAPQQYKDSSAAAIVASALLELSQYPAEAAARAQYRDAALRMLDSLSAAPYYAEGSASPGLLLHGVGDFPRDEEIDVSLIYGDYYFLEAVLRFSPSPPYPWYSKLSWLRSRHLLGSGNKGLQTIEFDVVPLAYPVDSVIGYSGAAATVTSYSSFAMAVRLNPSGYFDVRNGASYGRRATVTYAARQTYHVRISADLWAHRYSVWVRPPGGAEVQIASGFAFRSDAPITHDVGQVSVKSSSGDSEFRVLNHRLNPAPGALGNPAAMSRPAAGERRAPDEARGRDEDAP